MKNENSNTYSTNNEHKYNGRDEKNTYGSLSDITDNSDKSDVTWLSIDKQKYDIASKKEVSVFDVAAYIINKTGPISAMKLQKLVYYCQAWSLVWDEKPIFGESIEAWSNGPVIRELFAYHKGSFIVSNVYIGNPNVLTSTQKETIDAVLDFYGKMRAQELIDLSHAEKPWQDARTGLSVNERGNRIIEHENISEYYSSL